MTLIERLRNPAWYSGGPGQDARLQVEQTRDDMREAADRIQALTDALTEIERLGWKEGLGADRAVLPIGNVPPDGFMVGARGDKIAILAFGRELTREQALNLSAWLVALADPGGEEFKKYFDAVCNI